MRKILIADNQDISNAGWHYVFQNFKDISEILEVSNKKELLTSLTEFPDSIVILDYMLFDFNSVDELLILQDRFKNVGWILFSDELSNNFLQSILYNTHSFSVLMKDSTIDEIVSVLKEVLKGGRYICSYVSNILLESSKNLQNQKSKQILTSTELEILKEMALGRTTKEIATQRFVSVHTIMSHRKNIFRKIEVNNVHEATKYAMRAGIVNLAEYYI
jgi:DNA-binding NarL/FixJ family response regulator